MKDLTKILLTLSVFLIVTSIVEYREIMVEPSTGIVIALLMSACLSLIAGVIEISNRNNKKL